MSNDQLPRGTDTLETGTLDNEKIHFVTGRLAEFSLRTMLDDLSRRVGFDYSLDVLGITVAALMTPEWVAKRIQIPPDATRVLLPGYCQGDMAPLQAVTDLPIEQGPRDLRMLPEYFGRRAGGAAEYGAYDIEILAEINHAPRLTLDEILAEATRLKADGANLIDVGCNPGENWTQVGSVVRALVDAGHRVSIDSLNVTEIAAATKAGAELVLSVNSSNRDAAADWGCEVVVIPDDPATLGGLDDTVEQLAVAGVPLRIDPVLSPIGFGFAGSLQGYFDVRRRYADAEMMMGIGNLTELTDVDSAGVNVMLLGICQELGIRSVLTTQVINWARSSVRECDLARRLVHHAVRNHVLPKHLESQLVTLRDTATPEYGEEELSRLAADIKDTNYRIFAERDQLHLMTSGVHIQGRDPFEMFGELLAGEPKNMDAGHAFYLGFEMAKALTALTLDKNYRQDEALDWGHLTIEEKHRRLERKPKKKGASGSSKADSSEAGPASE